MWEKTIGNSDPFSKSENNDIFIGDSTYLFKLFSKRFETFISRTFRMRTKSIWGE